MCLYQGLSLSLFSLCSRLSHICMRFETFTYLYEVRVEGGETDLAKQRSGSRTARHN